MLVNHDRRQEYFDKNKSFYLSTLIIIKDLVWYKMGFYLMQGCIVFDIPSANKTHHQEA